MKVLKRILIKFFILLAIIVVFGGGAASFRAFRQSTPEYTVHQYGKFLIDGEAEKAYKLLDQSGEHHLSLEEYKNALEGKRYSLYSSCEMSDAKSRTDAAGNEYVDYHVRFMNAADEVQAEEDFTVQKQSERVFGVFDNWKVQPDHCLIQNYHLTVPVDSEVYIDGSPLDRGWIQTGAAVPSKDCYVIPVLFPGNKNIVIRHPILESVNGTFDPTVGEQDYSSKMNLKEAAQNTCEEAGIFVLKELYAASAVNKTDDLDDIFDSCEKEAKAFIKAQGKEFDKNEHVFVNAAISDFVVSFSDLNYSEEEDGSISTEMTLKYHYVVKEDVLTDTEEVLEDGTSVQTTSTDSRSGDNTALFQMSYLEGQWHVMGIEIPVI